MESNIDKLLGVGLCNLLLDINLICTMATISGNKETLQKARQQRKIITAELKRRKLTKKLKK